MSEPTMKDRVLTLYVPGEFGYKRVAKALGISRDRAKALVGGQCSACGGRKALGSRLCRSCAPDIGPPKKWDRRALFFAMSDAGMSTREQAAEIGTTQATIIATIGKYRAEGIPIPYLTVGGRGSDPSPGLRSLYVAMEEAGMSFAEQAEALGVQWGTISVNRARFRSEGLPLPSRSRTGGRRRA